LVPRKLFGRLPAYDKWHEQLPDPVPLEVELDRYVQTRAIVKRRDGTPANRLIGPSIPRNPKLVGGLCSVTSIVIVRSPRPIHRVCVTREPTVGVPPPSRRELTRLSCHSVKCDGSVM
jgi:hypothetical protein